MDELGAGILRVALVQVVLGLSEGANWMVLSPSSGNTDDWRRNVCASRLF